ncbi:MAG: hypothetical protein Q8P60_08995 [Pseudorhodobacter sp.]|nr:hypothetical protein [Pseudorhodobacter sp.]
MTLLIRLIITGLCVFQLTGLDSPTSAQTAPHEITPPLVRGQHAHSLQLVQADASAAAARYQRPFGAKAPWNIPVAKLARHPDSDWFSQLLWKKSSGRPGNFNLGFDDYTYPVYYVSDATGMFPVRTAWPSNLNGVNIPWNPAWRAAPGKDAQIILLDPVNGREWDLFQVRFAKNTVIATNANRVPGDYRTRTIGYPPSRGAGIPYLAMLVRPAEIAAGKIEHALSMPIRNPSGEYFVPPATKLEHATGKPGIPQGMRFALNVTEAEIQAWAARFGSTSNQTRRSAVVIARALRDYGWFITDTSGGATFQFEANVSARNDWAKLGLERKRSQNGRVLPLDLLDGLITSDRIYAIISSNKYPPGLRP